MDADDTQSFSFSDEQYFHEQCEKFIAAWQAYLEGRSPEPGPPPIRRFLGDTDDPAAAPVRHKLFAELLDIDLNYRWEHDIQHAPRLAAYLLEFPEFEAEVKRAFRIGRYEIRGLLGDGAFGRVYRAWDPELEREVAIKVPQPGRTTTREDVEAYLREARNVAMLDHPHIVPVFDCGEDPKGRCFVVSKLIDGGNLKNLIVAKRPTIEDSVGLIAIVAEALHHAHQRGLVHRDIKPANILIDADGTPYLADFGLAIHESHLGDPSSQGGTPLYMSPEQARGEGHRVDPRSDIFSLGAVLYELLTGRPPFIGTTKQVIEQIASPERDAWPPSAVVDVVHIPEELDAICLRCLAKPRDRRYPNAHALAEDLRHFLEQPPKPIAADDAEPVSKGPGAIGIVPKGLRAFDQDDAGFFLELLPGPCDPRDGLPESIHFWKKQIEESDPDKVFSIGLIYGPSGCGKSSLVKAGLLPHLARNVVPFYIESTAERTETRLLSDLRKRCPGVDVTVDLAGAVAALRRGADLPPGQKILIVLDQFEQWLHAKRGEADTELVRALRQCDGVHVQCLVMVRDDFWMAVTRFFDQLELDLLKGHNCRSVDLFPVPHARKILGVLGRANGDLPHSVSETTPDQEAFLEQAASLLAEDGKVVCVRLALFADMMKRRPWTPASLKDLGGMQGLGVTFLDATFSSPEANPKHRYHQKSARATFKALLPESGTNIKGHMCSREELLQASGYSSRPRDFDDLMHILDSELRLTTPTDPEGQSLDEDERHGTETSMRGRFYRLTHDYLVPSLREWLTRKQKQTRKGRAELRLAERAALWSANPQNRLLPAWWELIDIWLYTIRRDWAETQRQMMRRAAAVAVLRLTVLVVSLSVAFSTVWYMTNRGRQKRADALAEAILVMQSDDVPYFIADLGRLRRHGVKSLRTKLETGVEDPNERLRAFCALAELGHKVTPREIVSLIGRARGNECKNVVSAMRQFNPVLPSIAAGCNDAEAGTDWPTKARLAIVALHLGETTMAADMLAFENRPDPIQRTVFIDTFATWHSDVAELADIVSYKNDAGLCSGISLGTAKK